MTQEELARRIHEAGPAWTMGTDLDGVVIDHAAAFVRAAADAGYPITPAQANTNLFERTVQDDAFAEEAKHRVYAVERAAAPEVSGAIAALHLLASRLFVATVQKEAAGESLVWPWLEQHGVLAAFGGGRECIHVFRSRREKVAFINERKPTVFIDDGLDVLEDLDAAIIPILFAPSEVAQALVIPERIAVVGDWQELLGAVGVR